MIRRRRRTTTTLTTVTLFLTLLLSQGMDLHSNPPSELGKLEHIVSQFLLKSLHIILDSRIPSLRPHDRSGDLSSVSRVKKSDKWFNLIRGDRPAALENLNFWHRNVVDPMIIDIILVHEGLNSSSVDNLYTASTVGTPAETVIERWVVQYESPRVVAPQTGEMSVSYKKTYQKSIVLLRALYSLMRLLPAHKIFKQLTSSSHTYNFDIIYKVSSFGDPFTRPEEKLMEEYSFTPVEAFPGRLCMSVTYHSSLSNFNLEPSTAMPPKIITDYVGSPATDPLRSFPASDKGVRATSFPLRGVQSPSSAQSERPHSWTSGFHRPGPFIQNQTLFGSPPAYRPSPTSSDFPSSPNDMYPIRVQNRLLSYQKTIGFDEYQLSPPFSSSPSPSPSPSPPTYFYNGNPNSMQARRHSETAPVSIPSTMTARGSRYISSNFSDPNRNSLPPLSPRSTRNDTSSQESPSGIRSLRRLDPSRAGETPTGNSNHFTGPKALKDSKDDSGRFSGPLSSSDSPRVGFSPGSGRLSFQDDSDDLGFSCPFDVDDLPDFHPSQNLSGKRSSDSSSLSQTMVRKSQSHDAAVGVLVHMLRNAPPLRQDSSCYSTNSFKAEPDGGITTASGFFMPRKAADALEELRSYREMKDLLLSKSGTRVVSKEA
ncbi:autophagy-related protein 13a isoform X2 [Humulus lupulus]|uniref:autophagy-related protein 13a isoform X2 n=1 Tax=Humulus lupulus TaxID=3486 RepID=UPI002B40E58E|nr:autophagy-related protein 13a isoform X2 [Humulus lupulus]